MNTSGQNDEMDLITHSMTGLFIGAAAATKKDRLYAVILTGVLAAALIDLLDVWLYPVSKDLFFRYHRVYTHSLLGSPFYAAIGALPGWLWVRGRYRFLYLIALTSILAHLAMDVVCEWPILLLFPLSKQDFSLGYIIYSSRLVLFVVTIFALGILFVRQRMESKNIY